MIIKSIQTYGFINKIKDYKKHNKELLELIKKVPTAKHEDIYNTDWKLPKNYKREYLKKSFDIISNDL